MRSLTLASQHRFICIFFTWDLSLSPLTTYSETHRRWDIYTHYYTVDNTSSREWQTAWPQLVEDAQKNIDSASIPIGGPDFDAGPPIIDVKQGIHLNGVGDDGHEPLCLDRHGNAGFSFIKTARKPYDEVVACILLRAAVLAPTCVRLSSDGDWEHDWSAPRQLSRDFVG
ncbi:hypothetical protein KXV92_003254 [Aspergillus fumigatus]|nr:hypothetical protein KXX42_009172 [Aspergillus fumigatus]KAH1557842.1 hypothetical protein KXX57_000059 [Aspergillus fumigatus]KAH1987536.1 hypothetical protein KXW88_002848 [Aspergillus fumigatus]KAH2320172.1 hypothetical protein KXV47_002515 [Aspergillus fumigatus]KAH2674624.1 hypothetical protein KXV32_006032 [Aspergillus fumigatus]